MTVLKAYEALVASGELPDPEQAAAAVRLNTLATELATPESTGFFARFSKKSDPRGVYLWGGVGRGKSMLMDLFFANAPVEKKRRVHFGEFMLEVHARIAAERRKEVGDPTVPVATAIADETRLLAFDEMMVTNCPDAMILSRLVTSLLDSGVTIVTTSNRPPADLYKNGLNREHFLPFIATIEQRLDVLPLNGPVDYRRDRLGSQDTWLVPNGPEATAQLSAAFFRLTDFSTDDSEHVPAEDLIVQGQPCACPSRSRASRCSVSRSCAARRGGSPTTSPSRGNSTPSSSSASPSLAPRTATRPRASSR